MSLMIFQFICIYIYNPESLLTYQEKQHEGEDIANLKASYEAQMAEVIAIYGQKLF